MNYMLTTTGCPLLGGVLVKAPGHYALSPMLANDMRQSRFGPSTPIVLLSGFSPGGFLSINILRREPIVARERREHDQIHKGSTRTGRRDPHEHTIVLPTRGCSKSEA
jgi:hypothetical protein